MSTASLDGLRKSLRRRLDSGGAEGLAWATGFVVVALLSGSVYLLAGRPLRPWPGSVPGMAFGIAAALLFAAAALYSLRRRAMGLATRWHLGRTRSWLYLHVYGGVLFLLLVAMHSAFRWPHGAISWSLWVLSLWTVLTGLLGLALQRWIPRVLASLSTEINTARIAPLIQEIRQRVEGLVASCDDPVRKLASRRIHHDLQGPRRSWKFFIDPSSASSAFPLEEVAYLRRLAVGDEEERLRQLEELLTAKHELDVHHTLQKALRVWLVVHLPASWLLMALIAVHIFSVLYF